MLTCTVCVCYMCVRVYNRPDSFDTVAVAINNGMCCFRDSRHVSRNAEVDMDSSIGSSTRKQLFSWVVLVTLSRLLIGAAAPILAYAIWMERRILLNVTMFFGSIFTYTGFVLPIVGTFTFPQFLVTVVGIILPPAAYWRLGRIRQRVTTMLEAEMPAWDQLYEHILSEPQSKETLQRLSLLSCPFQSEKHRVYQMTSIDADSTLSNRPERRIQNGRLCEPVRSIDQLYLQAKSMVPYLSCMLQYWASDVDCFFKVEMREKPDGTAAATAAANGTEARNSDCINVTNEDSISVLIRYSFGATSVAKAENVPTMSWEKWKEIKVSAR